MPELQDSIFQNLDATQLATCCAVSKGIRHIASGHSLWYSLFKRRWGSQYLALLERSDGPERESEELRRRSFGDGARGAYAVEHYDKTLTVDQVEPGRALGDGWKAFGTIQECLDSELSGEAGPRDLLQRVVILPGTYMEHMSIEKVLGLIGGGAGPGDVVIQGDASPQNGTTTPIKWKVGRPRTPPLTLRQRPKGHESCRRGFEGR